MTKPHWTDKEKWRMQKYHAKRRNIDWHLSFEDWWAWWQQTGHYHERGPRSNQYVMARYGDIGAYSLSNIYCCTTAENISIAQNGRKKPKSKSSV